MKKYLSRSLNRKLVVFMAAVLGSSLAIAAALFVRVERANILDSGKDKVRFFAEIIKLNVSQAMVEGRCKDVAMIIQTLQASSDFKAVRILDAEGKIFESSRAGEKGKKAPFPVPHSSGKEFSHTYERNGEEFFCFTTPFHNEARCIRCHGEQDKVLGLLSVGLSLSSVEDKLASFTRMHIFLGFVVILMASGALFFFFSRFINRPIMEVSKKMAEVENGCFDVQLPVKSQDELGHLAGCFNLMAGNLKEMKKKDEAQQKILEGMYDDLQKRNQEISVLYQSFLAINRSLQIEEILRKTLEEVTESLDFDRAVLVVFNDKGDLQGRWSIGTDEDIVRRVQIPKRDIKGILYETYQKKEPILINNTAIYPIIERRGARK